MAALKIPRVFFGMLRLLKSDHQHNLHSAMKGDRNGTVCLICRLVLSVMSPGAGTQGKEIISGPGRRAQAVGCFLVFPTN